MISGKEMESLYKAMMKQVAETLQNESMDHASINQAARDSINKEGDGGVYKYVYDAYSPKVYARRYKNGGLADDNNLVTSVTRWENGATIQIDDHTTENPCGNIPADPAFYVSDIVESGHYGSRVKSPMYEYQWARPYLESSLEDGVKEGGVIDRAVEESVKNLMIIW